MSSAKFYGVKKGRETGVFTTWEEAHKSVKDFPGAKFRKFPTKEEAWNFVKGTVPVKTPEFGTDDLNYSKDAVKVFTDGSCITKKDSQGKEIRLAGYGVYFKPDCELNYAGYIRSGQTNQKVELLAIRKALEILEELPPEQEIVIFTDSMYSIHCITKWYTSWEKNGFKTKSGNPVKHLDIIQSIYYRYKKQNVKFVHVNSHRPEPEVANESEEYKIWYGNKQADNLANLAAKESAKEYS